MRAWDIDRRNERKSFNSLGGREELQLEATGEFTVISADYFA